MPNTLAPPIKRPESTRTRKAIARRTVVNVRLLAITLVAAAIIAPSVYFWYQHQIAAVAGLLLSRANSLAAEEKWAKAASYYQQYLAMHPEDDRALARLADALSHDAKTTQQQYRVNAVLYRTLGRTDDDGLRIELAENLLDLGQVEEALKEAKKLVDSPTFAARAQRVRALAGYAVARSGESLGEDDQSDGGLPKPPESWLLEAVKLNPGDMVLASLTAETLRSEPKKFDLQKDAADRQADAMIDAMVAANPGKADAYLARHRYRTQFGMTDAAGDLEQALAAEPNHFEALLVKADSLLRAGADAAAQDEAESLLRRSIEAEPANSRGPLALARLLAQRERVDEAISILRGQRKTAAAADPAVTLTLISLLFKANKLTDAEQELQQLQSDKAQLFAPLPAAARRMFENQIRLAAAQLDFARQRYADAVVKLQSSLGAMGSNAPATRADVLQARSMLAESLAALGRYEAAAPLWRDLADRIAATGAGDGNDETRQRLEFNANKLAAEAYLKANQPDRAIEALERCKQIGTSPDLNTLLTQAHLAWQLNRDPAERNWSEFNSLVSSAPQDVRTSLAKIDYLLSESKNDAVLVELRAGEQAHGDDTLFWRGAALAYQELGKAEEVQRALDKYLALEKSPFAADQFRALLLAKQQKWDEADAVLAKLALNASGQEEFSTALQRIAILTAANKLDDALELCQTMAVKHPDNAQLLRAATEVALAAKDAKLAESWETALEKLKGADDYEVRYLRCVRWLLGYEQLDAAAKERLNKEIESLQSERARWHPAAALAGRYAELNGDASTAIAAYRNAIDLGDASDLTLERLINLCAKSGNYSEAEKYVKRLSLRRPSDAQLESAAISLAVRQKHFDEAVTQARRAVSLNPEAAQPRIWLASVLALDGRREEAGQEFARIADEFPADAKVWKSWLSFLLEGRQLDEVRGLLKRLSEQSLSAAEQHRLAGEAYAGLGELPAARTELEQAVAADPQNVATRLQLSRILMRLDVRAAQQQLEEILKVDGKNSEARRSLATILASAGSDADWDRALSLLDDAGNKGLDDERLRALLLTRKGRTWQQRRENLQRAREIVEASLERAAGQAGDVDYALLAGIREQEAVILFDMAQDGAGDVLEDGRKALRTLLDRPNPSAGAVTSYVKYLLRNLASPVMAEASDEQRGAWFQDAEKRLAELDLRLASDGSGASAEALGLRISLLKLQKQEARAAELLKNYLGRQLEIASKSGGDADKAQLYLQVGNYYASLGLNAEAQACYRDLTAIAPNAYVLLANSLAADGDFSEAIELCLAAAKREPSAAVATAVAQLLSSPEYQGELRDGAQALIGEMLQAHNEDVGLLLSVGVLHVTREESDEAIDFFRRVLKLEPENTLALNNLATLLGEREQGRAEAIECINRAISIAGQNASLLDTRGTIYLLKGDIERAISDLEQAVAGGGGDARYYFHLAVAYQKAGRVAEAHQVQLAARRRGLDQSLLTKGDKALLEELEQAISLANANL
ncbi:MAG: tetratricopeptide repeat protein [Pirellulales bacterium]|nr:tetratricopeptide repeat protein [Pirellulales bacterium]